MINGEELRKWAAEYRIRQRGDGDAWPSAHQATFRHIKHLCQTDLEDYRASALGDPSAPWKRHNVNKAAHLSKIASSLSNRSANESAWRHGIEGIIVKRLSDEVTCPRCKYRLWRSEIECGGDEMASGNLGHQVLGREVCECSTEFRPVDPFEIETSHLFEDLVEGEIVHDDPGRLRLTQKPDRIIGLKETENITQLLEQPFHPQIKNHAGKIRSFMQASPLKRRLRRLSKPLLLPFLAIEAKSHNSLESFPDIQAQTALPIRLFLNLQWDLWKHGASEVEKPEPLVWFLGYKGNDWKIYACYRSERDQTLEVSYDIHHLQGGDLMTQEGALRLILIFDYIADWARDSYRPSVLKQLAYLATGTSFDKVRLGPDIYTISDSKAIAHNSSKASPDVQMDEAVKDDDSDSVDAVEHSNVNFLHIPTSKYGVIRPMNTAMFRWTGLCITEDNVDEYLPRHLTCLHDGTGKPLSTRARALLDHITKGDDMLVIAAADMGDLEKVWTGGESSRFHTYIKPSEARLFFVRLQYRCFIDDTWRIVRELAYLAISPPAMAELISRAASQPKVPGLHSIPERSCVSSGATLQKTIECLRAGSPWQVLRSALAGTAFNLHPCISTSEASTRAVAYFALDYVRSSDFSTLLHDAGEEFKRRHDCSRFLHVTVCSVWTLRDNNAWIENASHDDFSCRRCLASGQNIFALHDWDPVRLPSRSEHGAILVAALRQGKYQESQDTHALCLYLSEKSSATLQGVPFATTIKQLAQVGHIYHTILHPLYDEIVESKNAILWNLPWPYRKSTRRQQFDIARWIHDLSEYGSVFAERLPTSWMHIWVHQQMLLYYLRNRMDYDEAESALRAFRDESRALYRGQHNLPYNDTDLPLSCIKIAEFWAKVEGASNVRE